MPPKRKREDDPAGYWDEKKAKHADPQTPEQELLEAEAIKGAMAAQKAKEYGNSFGNVSTETKKLHGAACRVFCF